MPKPITKRTCPKCGKTLTGRPPAVEGPCKSCRGGAKLKPIKRAKRAPMRTSSFNPRELDSQQLEACLLEAARRVRVGAAVLTALEAAR